MSDHDIVYDVVMGSTIVRQVLASDYQTNGEIKYGENSGAAVPSAVYGKSASQKAMFATADLYTLFGLTNLFTGGVNGSSTTFTMPWQKRAQGTAFAGAGANVLITAQNWHAVCEGISADEESDPVARMGVHFRSTNGKTDPVSLSYNQTLAAQSYVGDYGFGPIEINGTRLVDPVGFNFLPGVAVSTSGKEGLVFPVKSYARMFYPALEIRFRDFDDLSNFAATFRTITTAAVYLRKRSGAGFVADDQSQHLKIGLDAGLAMTDTLSARGREAGVAACKIFSRVASYSRTAALE